MTQNFRKIHETLYFETYISQFFSEIFRGEITKPRIL